MWIGIRSLKSQSLSINQNRSNSYQVFLCCIHMSVCMHQAFKSAAGDTLENEANQITKINKKQ